MELTITQNGALYFAHHKLPKPRASLFLPLRRRRAPKRQSAESGGGRRRKELGWGKTELGARRKSDPDKIALARDLRSQTTMSLKWIARRLGMGSWTHVSNLLR